LSSATFFSNRGGKSLIRQYDRSNVFRYSSSSSLSYVSRALTTDPVALLTFRLVDLTVMAVLELVVSPDLASVLLAVALIAAPGWISSFSTSIVRLLLLDPGGFLDDGVPDAVREESSLSLRCLLFW
jgi:hypothetical protein